MKNTAVFKQNWLWISKTDLETELLQCIQEGRNVAKVRKRFEVLIARGDEELALPEFQKSAAQLLEDTQRLPLCRDYAFAEPSDFTSIRKLCMRPWRLRTKKHSRQALHNHIHGAWLGRCIGCFLGKPVELAKTNELWPLLKATGQYPLRDYMRFSKGIDGIRDSHVKSFARSKISFDAITGYMPVDDDTNYTTLGLLILEKYGRQFSSVDVATFWLENLPLLTTFTAERVAYRNFSLMMSPPVSATWHNPFREWIGAQIRADGFAYASAGAPALAAEFAWRDACISHVKNGIYGEMLMAACIAAAAYCDGPEEVLQAGCSHIPRTSRIYAAIQQILACYKAGRSYDNTIADIHARWNENVGHDWCHTISNAEICAAALLYGNGDFGDSICKAVWPCFDTDCNGATVGSIVGMMIGVQNIPARWARRINNTLHTSLTGNTVVSIEKMAERTMKMHQLIVPE